MISTAIGTVIAVIVAIAAAIGGIFGIVNAVEDAKPSTQNVATNPSNATISKDEALKIALDHAGLTADQVRVDAGDPEFGRDRGQSKWEIDFRLVDDPRAEYEYEIDAATGTIIKAEKPRSTKTTAPAAPAPETPAEGELTRDQAIDKALAHAGLTRDEVTIDERDTKIDYENGVKVWDVEFDLKSNPRADDYEYEIDAATGEIIKAEQPRTTKTTAPAAPAPETPAEGELTRDQAIDKALAHAGLTRDEVTIDERDTKIDYENGVKVWDVEFDLKSNPRADDYEYEINATTGEIIKAEQPRTAPTTTPAAPEQPAAGDITRDQAIDKALAHAGLTRDEVTINERDTKIDYDDGLKVWEVEFRSGDYEYDYEINAASGQILEFDKDYERRR